MVRSYEPVRGSDHVPVHESGLMEEVIAPGPAPRRKRRRKNDGVLPQEIQIKVYCPCKLCEMRPKPTQRLLSIVKNHIHSHNMDTKYKVTKTLLHLHFMGFAYVFLYFLFFNCKLAITPCTNIRSSAGGFFLLTNKYRDERDQ
jgi:hypothetical protein